MILHREETSGFPLKKSVWCKVELNLSKRQALIDHVTDSGREKSVDDF